MGDPLGRRAPVNRVRIRDPEGLRTLLQEVYGESGSLRKGAQRLGLKRDTFRRLLNGETRRFLSPETYSALKEAFGRFEFEWGTEFRFDDTVETADFGFYTHRYVQWLDHEFARLREAAHATFMALWSHDVYGRFFTDHLVKLGRSAELPGADETRQWLGLYRAVEPLAVAVATWGVERSWEDLDEESELRSFLRAALRNERALLKREGDVERMNLRPPPDEFLADLAGIFDEDQ